MAIRGGVRLPRRFWATARLCQVSASLRPCGHLDKSCAASCETARASLPNQASGELLRIRVCGASPMDFGPVYGASSARCGRPNRFVPANPSDCRTGSPCRDQAPGTANLSKLVTADQYPPSRPAAPCAVSLPALNARLPGRQPVRVSRTAAGRQRPLRPDIEGSPGGDGTSAWSWCSCPSRRRGALLAAWWGCSPAVATGSPGEASATTTARSHGWHLICARVIGN